MAFDISNLTKKELIALRRKVDRAIESIDARTLDKARREARQLAQSYGLALGDLIEAPKSNEKSGAKPKARKPAKRGKVKPKYRDPANPKVTWSGRGRTPKWVAEALAGGASLADLAV
jgi:DNA-binding protein H-NS